MTNPINIVIADSQPIFRIGLRQLLTTKKRFNIVGEVDDGEAALETITQNKPHLAILSIELPNKDGFEVVRTIFAQSMPVKMIFLTQHRSRKHFNNALNLGVKGYVLKDCDSSHVLEAITMVSEGNCFISPVLSSLLINRNRRRTKFLRGTPSVTELTPCEKRILVLVGQYMTSKAIADELFVSVRTVEHHREHIADKLGLHGRHCLLKFALEHQYELA